MSSRTRQDSGGDIARMITGDNAMQSLAYDDLKAFIELYPDPILVTDGAGVIILLNRACERLYGERRESLLGRPIAALEGVVFEKSATLQVLHDRKTITVGQEMLKTGHKIYLTSRPVFDDSGTLVMVINNARDFNELERLRLKLEDTRELVGRYQAEIEAVKSQLIVHSNLVARDRRTLDVLYKLNKSGRFDSTVLIQGETGTGKEEFAKYLHSVSPRKDKPFIKVNCGAIAESLMESEFFGYESGAFTGAKPAGKAGLFEVADTGAIFLDEIGELPAELQVKLLRVLQEREVTRISGTRPLPIDVRVIAATNRDLEHLVGEKIFREDLFYRLNVIRVDIPPLRQRSDDIIPLAQQFIEAFNTRHGLRKSLSRQAGQALRNHNWPGNVRELKNVIEQALVMGESDKILPEDLPFTGNMAARFQAETSGRVNLPDMVRRLEYYHIKHAYQKYGSFREAAASLNMPATTFRRKYRAYSREFAVPD